MQVAFIPPKGLEARMGGGDIVLSLAPQILEDDAYSRAVAARGRMGQYVIMDNGKAEGFDLKYERIREAQLAVSAKEVVLPDVLGDTDGTIRTVDAYLQQRKKDMLPGEVESCTYMAIAQGTSKRAVQSIVDYYSGIPTVAVVGIPRLLLQHMNLSARIDLANWIRNKYDNRFQIHLLGTSPLWCREVASAAKYAPHIRSVDTSMPYNYAMAGQFLENTTKQISRPDGYFDYSHKALSEGYIKTIIRNEEVLLQWAHEGIPSRPVKSAR